MKYKNQEEIDECARELIRLKDNFQKYNSIVFKQKYLDYQRFCIGKFKYLVDIRVGKYRKFSNFKDLEQDGYEALILALKTYNPNKGSFTWWADKYISTRVSRAANTHSTIRFPLKKAKELKPFKTTKIPILIDARPDALENIQTSETTTDVLKAIKELPEDHQKLINLIYGFQGMTPHSIGNVLKTLSISRPQCLKILEEAKIQLKEKLTQRIYSE